MEYETHPVATSLVLNVIVTLELPTSDATMLEMSGGVTSGAGGFMAPRNGIRVLARERNRQVRQGAAGLEPDAKPGAAPCALIRRDLALQCHRSALGKTVTGTVCVVAA